MEDQPLQVRFLSVRGLDVPAAVTELKFDERYRSFAHDLNISETEISFSLVGDVIKRIILAKDDICKMKLASNFSSLLLEINPWVIPISKTWTDPINNSDR